MALIKLENIDLTYKINERRIKDLFVRNKDLKNVKTTEIKALRDLNLIIRDGDRIGVLGHNGAGKSSLLKLISNISSNLWKSICRR